MKKTLALVAIAALLGVGAASGSTAKVPPITPRYVVNTFYMDGFKKGFGGTCVSTVHGKLWRCNNRVSTAAVFAPKRCVIESRVVLKTGTKAQQWYNLNHHPISRITAPICN